MYEISFYAPRPQVLWGITGQILLSYFSIINNLGKILSAVTRRMWQPPIAQLVERRTVDDFQQISLGRWFESGSVEFLFLP